MSCHELLIKHSVVRTKHVFLHNFVHVSNLFQSEWDAAKIFEEDAPKKADPDNTYVATFPYPYMNGKLHLGKIYFCEKVTLFVHDPSF